ncbi:Tn3 family transposase [Streptosporangium roseum]|uniref:Tn3 family transposase n=1 Tax=Streptosporangium roseum TaxID=2001 RepID=UPI0033319352
MLSPAVWAGPHLLVHRTREIQEGLNVVGSSNGANSVIFYGKGGDIATNRREELEMSVLCLRILQAALVYINTLMLQDVLADPEWAQLLEPADQRGLTPLLWQHVQPYGEVRLDGQAATARQRCEGSRGGRPGVASRSVAALRPRSARCEPHLWSRRKAEIPARVG